jgi:hypothetical protein
MVHLCHLFTNRVRWELLWIILPGQNAPEWECSRMLSSGWSIREHKHSACVMACINNHTDATPTICLLEDTDVIRVFCFRDGDLLFSWKSKILKTLLDFFVHVREGIGMVLEHYAIAQVQLSSTLLYLLKWEMMLVVGRSTAKRWYTSRSFSLATGWSHRSWPSSVRYWIELKYLIFRGICS